jgi:hypothetical protein
MQHRELTILDQQHLTRSQLLPALHHPTPIVTTTHHNIVTATSKQLSNNGILPKPTLAPKPNKPTVAPRVQGAKRIAEAQQLKKDALRKEHLHQELMRRGIQFDRKKEICVLPPRIAAGIGEDSGNKFCINGKVVPRNPEAPNVPSFGLPSRNK